MYIIWSNGDSSSTQNGLCAGEYGITVTDDSGCVAIDTVTILEAYPINISLSVTKAICGTCTGGINIHVYGGISPYSYLWSSGDTTEDIFGLCAGLYSATIIDSIGCLKDISVMINEVSFISVWPGDANNDLIANNTDLLPIGLYFGETGIARDSISNQWLGQCTPDWPDSQSNGTNKKHVDCNGDGVINDADTLAINLNYGLSHAKAEGYPTPAAAPALALVPRQNLYDSGDTVFLDIVLGSSTDPVGELYGISFNISFDNNKAKPGTVKLYYTNSWLGNVIDNLMLSKIFEPIGKADGAIVRTNHQSVSGYGTIGTLEFVANTNINFQQYTIGFTDYEAVDADGNAILFDVQLLPTGISEINPRISLLRIYPNPFTLSTTIDFTLKQDSEVSLKIYDVVGRVVFENPLSQRTKGIHQLQFENIASGEGLFIAELNVDGIKIRKRLVQIE